MKKICSLLLALCVVLSCMSVSAAEASVQQRTGMKPAMEKPVEMFEYGPIVDDTRYKVNLVVEGNGEYGSASISGFSNSGTIGTQMEVYIQAFQGCIAEVEYSYDYKEHEAQMYYMGSHVFGVLLGDGDVTVNVRFAPAKGASHEIITGVSGKGSIDVWENARPGEQLIAHIRAYSESYEVTGVYIGYEDGTPIDCLVYHDSWDSTPWDAVNVEFIMPNDDVVIYAEFKYKTSKHIELQYDGQRGFVTLSDTDVEPGEEFVFTAVPYEGCTVGAVEASTGAANVKLTPCGTNQWKGVMPNEDIMLNVWFDMVPYKVSVVVEQGIGGKAWTYVEEGYYGTIYEISCEPDDGYYVARVEADNARIGYYYDSPYAFVMPAKDVEVRVLFLREGNPFVDVIEGSFFYDPVAWALENNITTGTSATTFGPTGECLRAHVVTFLWRSAGCPEPTSTENPFVDVKEGDFFHKAVLWAVENGITNGVDATHFGPTVPCNRAQVVTFLYRAMQSPAVGTTACPFTDVQSGAWYEDAILWAVENGITNGLSADTFGVDTTCNRAQVVTFLYRTYVN